METIILESDAEKKADLSAKWKEEILKYFAEELHFADKNQVEGGTLLCENKMGQEDEVCPYCGKGVLAIDIKKHPISGKICEDCLNSIVSNKSAIMELVNDCIYSLDCFFGLKQDKRVAVKTKKSVFSFL